MKNFKTSLKALGAIALIGLGSLAVSAPASAQSLSDILAKSRQDQQAMSAEDNKRLEEFKRDAGQQSTKMTEARNALAAANGKANALENEFEANEAALSALEQSVADQAGDFQELLGQFRTAAGETMPEIANSFANFEYTGRVEGISEIAQARVLPTRAQLERLPKAMIQEMIAQSEVKAFKSKVNGLGKDGENVEADLMRVGVFTAATTNGNKFVEVKRNDDGSTYLEVFKRQPAGAFASGIGSLKNAGENAIVRAPVDPSKGNLFGILGELPSFQERINDGGFVGYVIIALLIVGLLIAVYKILTMMGQGAAMRSTAKSGKAGDGNPLARLFKTYEANKGADIETLELKLDEQIVTESPKMERFNDLIKVLASVAPLLGLLGTVVGMIQTFTAITIYGAGDPKLMADGISTALVTTVQGLVAAIPLLLMYSIVASMTRGNQQILDEQAAGMIARKAEGKA